MKRVLSLSLVLFIGWGFAGCAGEDQEAGMEDTTMAGDMMMDDMSDVTTVDASTIDTSMAAMPMTPFADSMAVNGEYCCVCQTATGQARIQLTGVASGFPVGHGCEAACRNAGHQAADGSMSHGGSC